MSSGNDEVQRELTDLARPARLMRDAETTVSQAVDVPHPIVLIEPRALHRDCPRGVWAGAQDSVFWHFRQSRIGIKFKIQFQRISSYSAQLPRLEKQIFKRNFPG